MSTMLQKSLRLISIFRYMPNIYPFVTRDSIYAIVRICHRTSVCPSVTRVDQSKTVERKVNVMQFSPYSCPIPLVFVA